MAVCPQAYLGKLALAVWGLAGLAETCSPFQLPCSLWPGQRPSSLYFSFVLSILRPKGSWELVTSGQRPGKEGKLNGR
jgi:hypothetical protein